MKITLPPVLTEALKRIAQIEFHPYRLWRITYIAAFIETGTDFNDLHQSEGQSKGAIQRLKRRLEEQ